MNVRIFAVAAIIATAAIAQNPDEAYIAVAGKDVVDPAVWDTELTYGFGWSTAERRQAELNAIDACGENCWDYTTTLVTSNRGECVALAKATSFITLEDFEQPLHQEQLYAASNKDRSAANAEAMRMCRSRMNTQESALADDENHVEWICQPLESMCAADID